MVTIGNFHAILLLVSILLIQPMLPTKASNTPYGVGDRFEYIVAKQVTYDYGYGYMLNYSCLFKLELIIEKIINSTILVVNANDITYYTSNPCCYLEHFMVNISYEPRPEANIFFVNPGYSGKAEYIHFFDWKISGIVLGKAKAIHILEYRQGVLIEGYVEIRLNTTREYHILSRISKQTTNHSLLPEAKHIIIKYYYCLVNSTIPGFTHKLKTGSVLRHYLAYIIVFTPLIIIVFNWEREKNRNLLFGVRIVKKIYGNSLEDTRPTIVEVLSKLKINIKKIEENMIIGEYKGFNSKFSRLFINKIKVKISLKPGNNTTSVEIKLVGVKTISYLIYSSLLFLSAILFFETLEAERTAVLLNTSSVDILVNGIPLLLAMLLNIVYTFDSLMLTLTIMLYFSLALMIVFSYFLAKTIYTIVYVVKQLAKKLDKTLEEQYAKIKL